MAEDCDDPKETIRILEALKRRGFSDQDFKRLHHMQYATIAGHIRYCCEHKHFRRGSNNRLVQKRLLEELAKRSAA